MDPNETLKQLREAMEQVESNLNNEASLGCWAADALHLFQALDEWLSKGGFLPEEWKP